MNRSVVLYENKGVYVVKASNTYEVYVPTKSGVSAVRMATIGESLGLQRACAECDKWAKKVAL